MLVSNTNKPNITYCCKKKSISSFNIIKYIFQFIYKLMPHLHWTDSVLPGLVSEGWAALEPWIWSCLDLCSGQSWPLLSPPLPLETQVTEFINLSIHKWTVFQNLIESIWWDIWQQSEVLFFLSVKMYTFLSFSLELAGNFGKEFEGETCSCLPVTDATFAVASLAALNSVGPIQAVWRKRKQ